MSNETITFMLFWGIWLIVPMFIDGLAVISQLLGAIRADFYKRRALWTTYRLHSFPVVSIIIPVRNGGGSVGRTISSIRMQNYPKNRIELIIVDNGSTDTTEIVIREQQLKNSFSAIHYIRVTTVGKSQALNIGIYKASGTYITNIDADVDLHPQAIISMVRAFEADDSLVAATGVIEPARSAPRFKSTLRYLIGECEFFEYVAGFRIGRQHQSVTNSLYTLAGAFSFFRREVLLMLPQYSSRTVSEDTDTTLYIHEMFPKKRIVCVPDAIAYVEPTTQLGKLYSQRVRWQRGELEVAALHYRTMMRDLWNPAGNALLRTVVVDHTLAFPRLVWTFLLPLMFLLGYPLPLVISALLLMYLFYVGIDELIWCVCYILSPKDTRDRLGKIWWVPAISPTYKFVLFWLRFGGFLTPINDRPEWNALPPWGQTRMFVKKIFRRAAS